MKVFLIFTRPECTSDFNPSKFFSSIDADLSSICFAIKSLHSTPYLVAYHPAPLNTTDDHNFYNPLVVYVSTESSVPHHIQIVFPHGMLTEQEGSAENE